MTKAKSRGQRFAEAVIEQFDLGLGELELLTEIERTLDACERLEEAASGADPLSSAGRLALGEARQQRLALARLLGGLGVPEDVQSPRSVQARRAALSRWAGHEKRSDI